MAAASIKVYKAAVFQTIHARLQIETGRQPRGGGTPLKGLNGDVRPARVCFSGFLS